MRFNEFFWSDSVASKVSFQAVGLGPEGSPQAFVWPPFEGGVSRGNIIKAERAEGVFIYGEDGSSYLDLISSWWVNLYGHANTRIVAAISKQASRMEHVLFAGFTHGPAVDLCNDLANLLPARLNRFFFSDNGSTAVEVALKLAYQYWHNRGERSRNTFLAFDGGYHGDTWGAMSVGKGSGFYSCFESAMLPVELISYPETWEGDDQVEAREAKAIEELYNYLAANKGKVAAFILEPLIQGAGGMRKCRKQFLAKLISILKENQILVICDEVMTGFGRTGKNFAIDHLPLELMPDFICLAKGITGGFMPLALTIAGDHIYEYFRDQKFAFNHGHSYSANPLACAAALVGLQLLAEHSTAIAMINRVNQWVCVHLLKHLEGKITKVRLLGTILAFDVVGKSRIKGDVMPYIYARCLNSGLLVRPLGRVIYTIPPYCITDAQLKAAYAKLAAILDEVLL